MSVEFESEEFQLYNNRVMVGNKAAEIMATEHWKWLKDKLFKTMEKDALTLLKVAKNDEDRLLAQQMYRAAIEPEERMDFFVKDGEGSAEILKKISNPQTEESDA